MIELMVVMSLIVILATMGMAQYRDSVVHARESGAEGRSLPACATRSISTTRTRGSIPRTLDALVSDGYMRKIPEDPFTKSNSTWQTVPAEPDPNNPTAEAGVYDVKSGSEATALDGTKYAEWD